MMGVQRQSVTGRGGGLLQVNDARGSERKKG